MNLLKSRSRDLRWKSLPPELAMQKQFIGTKAQTTCKAKFGSEDKAGSLQREEPCRIAAHDLTVSQGPITAN